MTGGLSAVFVTHDSEHCIEDALASVRRHFPDAELVVVDNASRDRTREVVEAFGGAQLVAQEENLGFGRACNLGVDNTTGTHLLFVNPDARIVSVNSGALQELLGARPCGLVGPYFVTPNASAGSVRGGLRTERHWLYDYLSQTFGLLRPRELPPRPPRARRGGARWLSASVVLAEREELDRLGRFDPRFFLYYEDRELSARYRDAGLPIRSTPAICVAHRGGDSSRVNGFRTAPHGWALLGWIQYVDLRHGPRVAARAGWLTLRTLRSLEAGLRIARLVAAPRLERKRREVAMVLDFIADVTARPSVPPRDFCPSAIRHLAQPSRFRHRILRGPGRAH